MKVGFLKNTITTPSIRALRVPALVLLVFWLEHKRKQPQEGAVKKVLLIKAQARGSL